jgi:hypothetical protein
MQYKQHAQLIQNTICNQIFYERPQLCLVILTKNTKDVPICLSGSMFATMDLITLERS